MDSKYMSLIGLIVAALIAFLPQKDQDGNPVVDGDAFHRSAEQYREGVATILIEMKDDDKTDAVAKEMTKRFATIREPAFDSVKDELLSFWWNGNAEEAAILLREHKTTGVQETINAE